MRRGRPAEFVRGKRRRDHPSQRHARAVRTPPSKPPWKAVAPHAARCVNSGAATIQLGETDMKTLPSASFAAALLLAVPAWAQSSSEPANQTPDQNQKMSQQYQGMVSSNPGF